MPLGPSRITERLDVGGRLPVLHAFGDPDDPLRLTVLLAAWLGRSGEQQHHEDVQTCLNKKAGYKERLQALADLLRRNHGEAGYFAALVDPDALQPSETDEWDDPFRRSIGRAFFQIVLDAVDRGGWYLVRTDPSAAVTTALDERSVEEGSPANADPNQALFQALAPETRSCAEWLVAQRHLRERDVERIIGTVEDFDDEMVALAYDSLRASARGAVHIVSSVRAPSMMNGTFGDFAWRGEVTGDGLPRADIEDLVRCGFLRADDLSQPTRVRMPRRVRRYVERHARIDEHKWRGVHAWLASGEFEARPIEEQVEVHFHAVQAGDVARATQTARYYGSELRSLATRLSRVEHDYPNAAKLFAHLKDEFDATDPYVWEYWAFNLARWDSEEGTPGRHEADVRKGYGRADELTKHKNPLYRGRFLGYLAERGDDVRHEFNRGMATFLREFQGLEHDAISRFAEAVLDGLKRSRRSADRQALFAQWKSVLERYAPRVVDKHGG